MAFIFCECIKLVHLNSLTECLILSKCTVNVSTTAATIGIIIIHFFLLEGFLQPYSPTPLR